MKQELIDKLHKKYPLILVNGPEISVGDGWYGLVDEICKQLTIVYNESGIQFTAAQIKEKFGGLRFYIDYIELLNPNRNKRSPFSPRNKKFYIKYVYDIIDKKEMESLAICEECGGTGTRRQTSGGGGGWIKTLCTQCESKHKT